MGHAFKVNIFHRNLGSSLSLPAWLTSSQLYFSICVPRDNEFRVEAIIHIFFISASVEKQVISFFLFFFSYNLLALGIRAGDVTWGWTGVTQVISEPEVWISFISSEQVVELHCHRGAFNLHKYRLMPSTVALISLLRSFPLCGRLHLLLALMLSMTPLTMKTRLKLNRKNIFDGWYDVKDGSRIWSLDLLHLVRW